MKAPELFSAAVSLFYPPICEGCGGSVASGHYLCAECQGRAPRIVPPFCEKCAEPFPGATSGPFACGNCANLTLHFKAAVAGYRARGVVRRLIHEFKYQKRIYLRHVIGEWLAAVLHDPRMEPSRFDVIIPVPLHPAKQRERGFNQAELLARSHSVRSGLPVELALERVRFTQTQTVFDRVERMENLHNAFRLRRRRDVQGLRVLLVDDVLTTGSTLSECARVLRRAGASSVYAATAARA
ncbi:MAG TPA: ComF family protein [Chthoniobacterales bacterium]|nr:ComF family protein [Chthoniobacterales bacterium]